MTTARFSHANCDHETSKTARAKCRKEMRAAAVEETAEKAPKTTTAAKKTTAAKPPAQRKSPTRTTAAKPKATPAKKSPTKPVAAAEPKADAAE
ncbi:hypothetical protein [Streptomyces wuyuanensis]|uniref:hypothetical protein n=1 Tax=Streptomyces wuyuanensis TaxID=1196353 RepID=UPI00342019AE